MTTDELRDEIELTLTASGYVTGEWSAHEVADVAAGVAVKMLGGAA